MNNKTMFDRIVGNAVTVVGAAGAAAAIPIAIAGVPQVPLVLATVCSSILPAALQKAIGDRYEARIEAILDAIKSDISNLEIDLAAVTEDQLQLTLDCASTIYSTLNPAKLEYLRQSIRNTLGDPEIARGIPEALGRLVRDVTAQELSLVIKLFAFSTIFVVEKDSFVLPPNAYAVDLGTPDEIAVAGLIRLGLLNAYAPSWDATSYAWSPLTAKLIALVREPRCA